MQEKHSYYCILGALMSLGTTGCQLLIPDESGGAGSTGTQTASANASAGTGTDAASSSSAGCMSPTCGDYCKNYEKNCGDSAYGSDAACKAMCGDEVATPSFCCIANGASASATCDQAGPLGGGKCGDVGVNYCALKKEICPTFECLAPMGDASLGCSLKYLTEAAIARARGAQTPGEKTACGGDADALCLQAATPNSATCTPTVPGNCN